MSADDRPVELTIYSFETSPFFEDGPPTGRYGAFKALSVKYSDSVGAALAGVWHEPPTFEAVRDAPILLETTGEEVRPAVYLLTTDFFSLSAFRNVQALGQTPLTEAEGSQAEIFHRKRTGTVVGSAEDLSRAIESEWRKKHDAEQLARDVERMQREFTQHRAAEDEAAAVRQKHLSLEQLLTETPLARWSSLATPLPPDLVEEARDALRQAHLSVKDLGPEPSEKAMQGLLENLFAWFYAKDRATQGAIAGRERDDVYLALEEIATVAGHTGLAAHFVLWGDVPYEERYAKWDFDEE